MSHCAAASPQPASRVTPRRAVQTIVRPSQVASPLVHEVVGSPAASLYVPVSRVPVRADAVHPRLRASQRSLLRECDCAQHPGAASCDACNEQQLQRSHDGLRPSQVPAGERVHPRIASAIDAARGGGLPLERSTRERLELGLGESLRDVRVHADTHSEALARAVSARAFTVGSDVFFAAGMYRPGSRDGDKRIAHEVTHAVQQRGAVARGPLTVSSPGDALELEADATASRLEDGFAFKSLLQPTASSAILDRPGPRSGLQQAAGNRGTVTAIQRLLEDESSPLTHVERQSMGSGAAGPSPGGLVQRQPDPNAPTSQPASSHCCGPVGTCPLPGTLTLPRFATSAKLENVREDKDRLGQDDPDVDAVSRIQQALVDVTQVTGKTYDLGATGPKKNGVDGIYGAKTAAAVSKFKRNEGLGCEQFGDVGPGTMKRLNELLNQPPPPPAQPTLNPPDCNNKVGDTLPVTGTGFPPGATVLLSVDRIPGDAALADAQTGAIVGSISASGLKSGSHVVEGTSGGAHAAAQFTCGAGPQPEPAQVPRTGTHKSTAEGDNVKVSNTVTGTEKVPADSSPSVEFSVETGITAIHYSRVPAPSPGGNCDTGHFQLNLTKNFKGFRINDRLVLASQGQFAIDIFPVICRQDPSLQFQLGLLKATIIPELLELNLNSALQLQGPPRAWSLQLEPVDLALSLKPWLKIPAALHLKLDLGTVFSPDPRTPNTNVSSVTGTFEFSF
jgi:peptidoglycan hydrolase-like protein with peptidoglycan-binding domain